MVISYRFHEDDANTNTANVLTEQSGVFEQDFLIPLVLLSERLNPDGRRVYSVVQNLHNREFRGFTQAVFANSAKLTTHDNAHTESGPTGHSVQTPPQGNALRWKQTWRVCSCSINIMTVSPQGFALLFGLFSSSGGFCFSKPCEKIQTGVTGVIQSGLTPIQHIPAEV